MTIEELNTKLLKLSRGNKNMEVYVYVEEFLTLDDTRIVATERGRVDTNGNDYPEEVICIEVL